MSNFIQFLIDKKVVNEEQLVLAAIAQLEKSKSFLSILLNDCHVPAGDLAKLIMAKVESGKTFDQIQLEYNLVDSTQYALATKNWEEQNKSIIGHLIEQGVCTAGQILELKSEFDTPKMVAKSVEPAPTVVARVEPAPVQQTVSDGNELVTDAALESLKELVAQGILPESALLEFATKPVEADPAEKLIGFINPDKFDRDLFQSITDQINGGAGAEILKNYQSVLDALKNKDSVRLLQHFENIYHILYRLKGAARLAGSGFIEHLLDKGCGHIRQAQEKSLEQLSPYILNFKSWIQLFFYVVKLVASQGSEEKVLDDKELLQRSCKTLEQLCA